MKKYTTLFSFVLSFFCFSQDKFIKYHTTVKGVENNMTLKTIKVKNEIYMIEGIGAGMGNIGIFISDDGVIMIDNSFEIIEEMISESLKKISEKPIKYIINTHYHYDHADGNRAFGSQKIPIIAHHSVRNRQGKISKLYGGIYPVLDNFYVPKHNDNELPTLTFQKKLSIHENGEEISIFYFGNGHTDGDSIIKFSKSNVIHTGDSFVLYGLPFIDISNGGSIKGFINNLDKIITICDEETIIIPGHGGLSNVNQVMKLSADLKDYYNKTLDGNANGLTLDEISNSIVVELGKNSLFGNPTEVKKNFIKSILLENNIIAE